MVWKSKMTRANALVASMVVACLVGAGCTHGHARPPAASTNSDQPTQAVGASGPELLLGEVRRELSVVKKTHYQHTTAVDEAVGKFFYDCSGMVDYALGRVLAHDAQALPTSTSKRPLAGDIERFLRNAIGQSVPGWQAVTRVNQLGPGDLVTWLATEDSTTGDTGHVMVVLSAPTANAARSGEWKFRGSRTPNMRASRRRTVSTPGSSTFHM